MSICISADHPLLTGDIIAQIRNETSLSALVSAMRENDHLVVEQAKRLDSSRVRLACQRSINLLLGDVALENSAMLLEPVDFAQAIYKLPRTPRTAPRRRMVREIARVYAQVCTSGLFVPKQPHDFHALWECAMTGEPRWSEAEPSSAFRSAAARILRGQSLNTVLQVCVDPGDYETELEGLVTFLQDTALEPEVRAACGYALFEWIHPFTDGNGHVGRMLALASLQDAYSLPSMVCFSWALAQGRGRTSSLFAPLRSGDGTLVGFCRGTLEQLHDAQMRALDMVMEA